LAKLNSFSLPFGARRWQMALAEYLKTWNGEKIPELELEESFFILFQTFTTLKF
jgi:hypothetical protein